jgi:hypothetical protein
MNSGVVIDCLIIAGFAFFGFLPFDKKRIRVGWAKFVFGIISVTGITDGVVRLAWDLGWFALGSNASSRFNGYLYMVGGVILGLIFSLILSGQLTGTKRDL